MKRTSSGLLARAAWLGAALLITAPALGEQESAAEAELDPAINKAAKERFAEGLRASDAGDYEAARVAFLQAYTLVPLPEVLVNLGVTEVEAGRLVEGARHISEYLRGEPATTETPHVRDRARERLEQAEQRVGRLDITVNLDAADIFVDGERVGKSPLGFEWHVPPGTRSVTVRSERGEVVKDVDVAAGEVTRIALELEDPGASAPANATSSSASQPLHDRDPRDARSSDATPTVLLIATSGLTVASAVGWFVAQRSVDAAKDDIDMLLAEAERSAGQSPCLAPSGSTARTCADIADRIEDGKTSARWRNVARAATGIFAAGTVAAVAYFVSSKKDDGARDHTRRFRVDPWITPSSTGLVATGTF